ncbi:unnamed protein product [Rhodiola kirilowii]
MKLDSFVVTLLSLVAQLCIPDLVFSQFDYPTANLSTTWTNHVTAPHSVTFTDGSTVRAILLRGTFGPKYACGFFCKGSCEKYLFAIFIVQTNSGGGIVKPAIGFPRVVWSPNRNHPVSLNSTLQLTSDGDLVLKDVDGAISWSTNTSGKSVVGLNMTEIGNLVLFNSKNETVWESFDHPSDALVPGQKLIEGKNLTSSASETNWTQSVFSLSVSSKGLFAFIEADPPQTYYNQSIIAGNKSSSEPSYIKFLNGSLSMYILVAEPSDPDNGLKIPLASSAQYMKLEADGHLRVYEWGKGTSGGWGSVADLLTGYLGDCSYPMVCGAYGICSNGQCACPAATNNGSRFFDLVNDRQPALGCHETSTLSCGASQYHEFVELTDTTYFTSISDIGNTDMETCKTACLKNCSCKAAMFRYGLNSSDGECYLPSNIFSLMNNDKEMTHYNSTAFLKVQGSAPITFGAPTTKKNSSRVVIIGASIGAFVGLFSLGGLLFIVIGRKKKDDADADEEEYLDQVPGMPTRFSYEELKIATEDFTKKLGEGGFGSVFEGKLSNGTHIAVKVLDGVGHIKKSFLAEVETIGSVHHINLVTLIGFCAEKSHRALVYEYMPNGSLEKWIFKPKAENMLDWKQRRKIILDIAKGLSYLHEDCRQKIVHLDIKPQNILLDEKFNAKVSDFGLSKLIDKDQSNVMTQMRGTPGYLAPEWLNSVITEKVDVYSFGVVVLEILCGRKNLDRSQAEEEMHLLSLFKSKGKENLLLDLVDKCSADMQVHSEEVVKMMSVAAWCLQSDFAKRPSMSVVVKVLEGVMDVDKSMDYTFVANTEYFKTSSKHDDSDGKCGTSTLLLPSVLSGPR